MFLEVLTEDPGDYPAPRFPGQRLYIAMPIMVGYFGGGEVSDMLQRNKACRISVAGQVSRGVHGRGKLWAVSPQQDAFILN